MFARDDGPQSRAVRCAGRRDVCAGTGNCYGGNTYGRPLLIPQGRVFVSSSRPAPLPDREKRAVAFDDGPEVM